ncbi:MAG: hypothetical protein RIC95_03110 [Vicingaceae bacterium]|jgi:H+/gluconate symporter-like permease
MVNIKIDFGWKIWTAIIVSTIGSIIIFGAIAYCIIDNPDETRKGLQKTTEKITEKAYK